MPNDVVRNEFPHDEDLPLQRRTWLIQRVGWCAMALLVGASLFGVFGGRGCASTTTVEGSNAALRVHYERFERVGAPAPLRIEIHPVDGQFAFSLSDDYLANVELKCVTPPAESIRSSPAGRLFSFGLSSGLESLVVTLDVRHRNPGRTRAIIRSGPDSVEFSQFVYP